MVKRLVTNTDNIVHMQTYDTADTDPMMMDFHILDVSKTQLCPVCQIEPDLLNECQFVYCVEC